MWRAVQNHAKWPYWWAAVMCNTLATPTIGRSPTFCVSANFLIQLCVFLVLKFAKEADYITRSTRYHVHGLHLNKTLYYKTYIKGILWDRQWSPPSIGIFPHICRFSFYRNELAFFYRWNTFLMKRSNLHSYRVSMIASQWTFEKRKKKLLHATVFSYFLIVIWSSCCTSSGVVLHVIFWE